MCPAIDLNGQLQPRAVEVENVKARRVLASKLEAAGSLAEMLPQEALGHAHVAA